GLAGGVALAGPDVEPSHSSLPDLTAGQTFGTYRIEREIGRGGMGIVYEAVHLALGKRVALKVLPIQGPRAAGRLERFLREAQTTGALHHTNIVPVFDFGQVHGTLYYAMQYIAGQGLDRVLSSLQALSEASQPTSTNPLDRTDLYVPSEREKLAPAAIAR